MVHLVPIGTLFVAPGNGVQHVNIDGCTTDPFHLQRLHPNHSQRFLRPQPYVMVAPPEYVHEVSLGLWLQRLS